MADGAAARGAGPLSGARRAAALAGLMISVYAVRRDLGPIDAAPELAIAAIGLALRAAALGGGARAVVPVIAGLPLIGATTDPSARLAVLVGVAIAGPPVGCASGAALAAAALAWRIILAHAPAIWMAEVGIARLVSLGVGVAAGQRIDLGPSASGLDLFLILMMAMASARLHGERWSWTRAAAAAGMLVVFMAATTATRGGAPAPFGRLPALGLGFALLLATGGRRGVSPMRSWPASLGATATALALSFAAAGLAIGAVGAAGDRRPGDILIVQSDAFDMEVPRADRPGIANAGMLGLLPRYLALDGHRLRLLEGPLTTSALRRSSVAVIVVPTRRFGSSESRAIRRFVERGGSLLVLADHTDLLGSMGVVNSLTARWGIRVNFDSAFPAVRSWASCLDRRAPWRGAATGIGTGASLDVRPPARPLIVARYAHGDAGDRANGGAGAYLGDYVWHPAEPLGDLPVVAEARHGRGRVVVFGDTSSFQNVVLPFSWPFVADLFDDLTRRPDRLSRMRDAVAALIAAALAGLALAGSRAAAAGLAGACLVASTVGAMGPGGRPLMRIPPEAAVALIDDAHMNDWAWHLWEDRSLGGLIVNLQRAGYLPIVTGAREGPRPTGIAQLPVFVEPRRPLSDRESRRIASHLEDGGVVLVAAGPRGGEALAPLLGRYGIRIGRLPLGPVPIVADMDRAAYEAARSRPQFRSAWPVVSDGRVEGRALHRAFGRDVVVEARVPRAGAAGRPGRLLVIADPDFLTDRVLENEHDAWDGNRDLLARLLAPERIP